MALENILNITPDTDVNDTKMALNRVFSLLADTSLENAKLALACAESVTDVAMEGGTCAEAYTDYIGIAHYGKLTQRSVSATDDVMTLLKNINASGDPKVDDAYEAHLNDMSCIEQVQAMLEGTESRLVRINSALPRNPQPAARFDPSVYHTESTQDGKKT